MIYLQCLWKVFRPLHFFFFLILLVLFYN
uniref:Uncharacterized protein n=1 Tax=Anguilla anguilla TaxID=7936 RepID=A0A0E9Q3V6_ANGAN